jgi:hypothetical protein
MTRRFGPNNNGGSAGHEPATSAKRALDLSPEFFMHTPWNLWLRIGLAIICAAPLWLHFNPRGELKALVSHPNGDLSATDPSNLPGCGTDAAETFDVYSALYQTSMHTPLVFAAMTDIRQVSASCLTPTSPQEREITNALVGVRSKHLKPAPFLRRPQSQ